MVSGGRTPADAAVSVVEHEVAVQSSVFIALVASVAQVALLARTDVAAVAAVLDGARRLAAWRVGRALARVHALTAAAADTRRLHTTHARSSPPSYSILQALFHHQSLFSSVTTLFAFAAERRAAALLLLSAPVAGTRRRRGSCRSMGQTDGQMDGRSTVT